MPQRLLLVLSMAAIAVGGCGPSPAEGGASDALVLRGATLIDGTGAPPLADAVVVVDDGRIVAAGPAGRVEVPAGARVEDLSGRFLLPGLIDVHAHALVPTCDGRGFDAALSERLVAALLRFGVTTARSPATPTDLGVALRDRIAAGTIPGPRLVVAGELIDDPQMSPEAVREEVRAQAEARVDAVKLYRRLSPEAVRAGIAAAHAHGLPAIGHLQRTSWTEGLAAGIDQLTHAAPWTEEMLAPADRAAYRQAQARRGPMRARIDWLEALAPDGPEVGAVVDAVVRQRVPLDPTLVAFDTKFSTDGTRPVARRYRDHPDRDAAHGLPALWDACGTPTDDWTPADFRRARAAWPTLLALVRRYHHAGVRLTAGSDTPNAWVIPGASLHRELELLVDAGIPPGDVLQIATRNGADALGLLDEVGTVEVGKSADLLVLTADPLADISNSRRIAWVMRGGERVDR
ncbi:amidohydrolase family protein [Rubrivirga sp. IMCC43871]|uniref:amidohydrolase family protein n=1 Tax=Rubrivirga sp. IMCC43871 TaxID=3391575 RepID=UPI003990113F